jgi:hypothetical protein
MPEPTTPSDSPLRKLIAGLAPKGAGLLVLAVISYFGWNDLKDHPWYAFVVVAVLLFLIDVAQNVWAELKQRAVRGLADTLVTISQGFRTTVEKFLAASATALATTAPRLASRIYDRIHVRYKRELLFHYGLFNDRGLGLINANRLDLENVYVDLRTASDTIAFKSPANPFAQSVTGSHSAWTFLRAVRPGFALVVIGAPGSGKTTLLQHMVLTFARQRHRKQKVRRRIPILLETVSKPALAREQLP